MACPSLIWHAPLPNMPCTSSPGGPHPAEPPQLLLGAQEARAAHAALGQPAAQLPEPGAAGQRRPRFGARRAAVA
eukprot:534361-Prymnesium_polylepis.1